MYYIIINLITHLSGMQIKQQGCTNCVQGNPYSSFLFTNVITILVVTQKWTNWYYDFNIEKQVAMVSVKLISHRDIDRMLLSNSGYRVSMLKPIKIHLR